MQEEFSVLPAGTTILNRYTIEGVIGKSTYTTVYRGFDNNLGRGVILKFLLPATTQHQKALERFVPQAKLISTLNHKNIINLYSYEKFENLYIIVTEFIQGQNLKALIEQTGKMKYEDAEPVFKSMLNALNHAHKKGVIHGNLNPLNVIIDASGTPKITNFGLTKIFGEEYVLSASISGTTHYADKDTIKDPYCADVQSDIFSAGAVLYFMLSAQIPVVIDVSPFPPHLQKIISKCTATNKQLRYSSVSEILVEMGIPVIDKERIKEGACIFCAEFHPDNMRFCDKTGEALFEDCPRCSSQIGITTTNCPSCGCYVEDEKRILTYINNATRYFADFDYEMALKELRKALDIQPNRKETLQLRDQILDVLNKLEQLMAKAEAAIKLQDFGEVENLMKQVLQINPKNKNAQEVLRQLPELIKQKEFTDLMKQAQEFLLKMDFQKALEKARAAKRVDTTSTAPDNIIDECKRRMTQARKILDEAHLFLKKGDLENAMKKCQETLSIYPTNPSAKNFFMMLKRQTEKISDLYHRLSLAIQEKRWHEAENLATELIRLKGNSNLQQVLKQAELCIAHAQKLFEEGVNLFSSSHFQEALGRFEQVKTIASDLPELDEYMAKTKQLLDKISQLHKQAEKLWQEERFEEAKTLYQQIQEINPIDTLAIERLKEVNLKMKYRDYKNLVEQMQHKIKEGKKKEALQLAEAALKVIPDGKEAGELKYKLVIRPRIIIITALVLFILVTFGGYTAISLIYNHLHFNQGVYLFNNKNYKDAIREFEMCGGVFFIGYDKKRVNEYIKTAYIKLINQMFEQKKWQQTLDTIDMAKKQGIYREQFKKIERVCRNMQKTTRQLLKEAEQLIKVNKIFSAQEKLIIAQDKNPHNEAIISSLQLCRNRINQWQTRLKGIIMLLENGLWKQANEQIKELQKEIPPDQQDRLTKLVSPKHQNLVTIQSLCQKYYGFEQKLEEVIKKMQNRKWANAQKILQWLIINVPEHIESKLLKKIIYKEKFVSLKEILDRCRQMLRFQNLRCVKTLAGIQYCTVSTDSKFIAGFGDKSIIKIWDIQKTLSKSFLAHRPPVHSVAWQPDGKILISSGHDRTIKIWDTKNWICIKTIALSNCSVSLALSPDGKIIASAEANTINLRDASNGQIIKRLSAHTDSVLSLNFSPDGRYLVSAGKDKVVIVWNVNKTKPVKMLKGHESYIYCVVFSPDSRYVASGGIDTVVRLWDIKTGRCVKILKGCKDWIYSITFTLDGDYVVAGSGDKSIRIWNAKTGECVETKSEHTDKVLSVSFCMDDRLLISSGADRCIKLWQQKE